MRALVTLMTLSASLLAPPATAADGLISIASAHSVEETADRLETVLADKGMTVFNRVRHSEAAAGAGVELRDTQLIIFGNPQVGSRLMACQQSVAVDLPQKALVWEDEDSRVWISYNDPEYLAARHAMAGCEEVTAKIEKALAAITSAAAAE